MAGSVAPRLREGMVLAMVQGVSVVGEPFALALQRVQLAAAQRPLRLTFVGAALDEGRRGRAAQAGEV